jgi:RND superfamily putative drug exporter
MSRLLARLGGAAAAHPWRTIGSWLIALLTLFTLSVSFGGTTHNDYDIAGTESQAGIEFLRTNLPHLSGTDARVVVHDSKQLDFGELEELRRRLADLPGVTVVSPPRMSADGDTALITVQYDIPVTGFRGTEGLDALRAAAEPLVQAGIQVEFGGQVAEDISAPSGTAELVGIGAALLVLVITLGSVIAAGLPIIVAIGGLGAAAAIIALLERVIDISTIAPTVATMVGLGVGIDYALLLVARHVEGLRAGLAPRDAAAAATATAGKSVVMAGLTVLVWLLGLKLSTLPVYSSFGYATFAAVGAVMAAALTLVPALCGLLGHRVLPRQVRAERTAPSRPVRTARWAARVVRRPVLPALLALAVLAALAAPALDLRTWPQDAGSQPTSTTSRRAYDLVAAEFGPGANGPLVLVADLTKGVDPSDLYARLRGESGIAKVSAPYIDGIAAVITVEPTTGPQDERTTELLRHLRASVLPDGVLVTGLVAAYADISDRLASRLWIVVVFVVGLSLVLLTALFRAPVVALKAALMNVLSVAAGRRGHGRGGAHRRDAGPGPGPGDDGPAGPGEPVAGPDPAAGHVERLDASSRGSWPPP